MGAFFKKPRVPDIKVNAPAIENPFLEPEAPELGAEEIEKNKKKKGKKEEN